MRICGCVDFEYVKCGCCLLQMKICILPTHTNLTLFFMVSLCNRADHIYFHPVVCSFFFLFFFPRLISVVRDWMSAILPHMVWPWCEFRMQV